LLTLYDQLENEQQQRYQRKSLTNLKANCLDSKMIFFKEISMVIFCKIINL